MKMERWWDDLTGENRSTRRQACSSATFPTANPTWTGSNISRSDNRPATNCLSLIIAGKVFLYKPGQGLSHPYFLTIGRPPPAGIFPGTHFSQKLSRNHGHIEAGTIKS